MNAISIVKRAAENFFTSGFGDRLDGDARRRTILTNLIALIGIALICFFSIFNFYHGLHWLSRLSQIVALSLVLCLLYLRRTGDVGRMLFFATLVITPYYLAMMFIDGAQEGGIFLWVLTVPLYAHVLLGMRRGTLAIVVFFVPMMLFLALAPNTAPWAVYGQALKMRLVLVFLTIWLFSHIFERLRWKSDKALQSRNAELQQTVARLEEAKGQLEQTQATLEQQVQQRTAALQQANQQLSAQMDLVHQAQEVLAASEARYRGLFERAPVMYVITNASPNPLIRDCNQMFLTTLGYTREQVIGQPLAKFYSPASQQRLAPEGHRHAIQSGSINEACELLAADQRLIPTLVSTVVETEVATREVVGVVALYLDISAQINAAADRERLQAKLAQAQRLEALGTLAGGIAHDFNNLLMSIQGSVSLMLAEQVSDQPFRQRLLQIEQSTESAAGLTRQLLGLARGGKYDVRPTDINALVKRVTEMFGRTRKEIALHLELQPILPAVAVDRTQFEQVLLNLCINAWQAMPQSGDLTVASRSQELAAERLAAHGLAPGTYVILTVTDTGVGMDRETQQRIFEPFFTTKEMGRGTGLGLASVYGIVAHHAGFIEVESQPGRGTRFTIGLPASDRPIAAEAEPARGTPPASGSGTILVVDDEPIIREITQEMLELLGYRVISAASGGEALELYRQHRHAIVLVLLDMILPGMDGAQIFKELKQIRPDVRVILCSGYSREACANDILMQGCAGFIQKPISIRVLAEKVQSAIQRDGQRPDAPRAP